MRSRYETTESKIWGRVVMAFTISGESKPTSEADLTEE